MDKKGFAKHGTKAKLLTAPRWLQGEEFVRGDENK